MTACRQCRTRRNALEIQQGRTRDLALRLLATADREQELLDLIDILSTRNEVLESAALNLLAEVMISRKRAETGRRGGAPPSSLLPLIDTGTSPVGLGSPTPGEASTCLGQAVSGQHRGGRSGDR